jgi:hypothetical protein
MLSDLRTNSASSQFSPELCRPVSDDRYARGMEDDMKEAIGLLFKLKAGLDKLHPECTRMIEKMMAQPNRY